MIYDFLKNCRGCVLVGAAKGHERGMFSQYNLNAIFVEARKDVISGKIHKNPKFKAFNYLVTDKDDQEYNFYVSSNRGLSSSIYSLKDHKKIWKRVSMVDKVKMRSITLDTLFQKEKLNPEEYDAMVVDVQGAELLVLKGAKNLLKHLTFIMVEVADFDAYDGCVKLPEMNKFMNDNGFIEIDRQLQVKKEGIGSYYDIVYQIDVACHANGGEEC